MKIYYAKDIYGNFGDDLNEVLWERLLPGCRLDTDDGRILVGIGTLLNNRIPKEPFKYVFGSGVGYGPPPVIDERWKFFAVRGPISAERLGLPQELAVTDPGILAPRLLAQPGSVAKNVRVAFMPHHTSDHDADWRSVCEEAGIGYITPRAPVQKVLNQLASTELLITEAMHGAIVADALRVPWKAVSVKRTFNPEKWNDWCRSLNLDFNYSQLPHLIESLARLGLVGQIKQFTKRQLYKTPLWRRGWSSPLVPDSLPEARQTAVTTLRQLANEGGFVLSDLAVQEQKVRILDARLEELAKELERV